MELIKNNPYRIAGLLSNATTKELEKNKSKFLKFVEVGKNPKSNVDFEQIGSLERTKKSLNSAFSKLEQNKDKVNYSLFWFLNTSPFDSTAIEYLKKGDEGKAVEIWEKVTTNKAVNSKNFSAFNNLGTVKLLSKNKSVIKTGIEAKIKLLESDYFKNFVHSVADETFKIDKQKQTEILIDELLSQFTNQYSNSVTLQLFISCNGLTQSYLSQKFTEEPIHKIESQIESCKMERKANKIGTYDYGLKLYTNTKNDLSLLESLLGTSDLKYKAVADQLANEIMQCGIDYFNESQENDSSKNYLESSQELTKLADSIAVGKLTKDRAKDSLASLEEMKDREVLQVIELLRSVKDSYETNKKEIRRQVRELEESDIQIIAGYKTIDKSAVEANIRNSIDWVKVNDLLKTILPEESLGKIKDSSNNQLKSDFIELANWLRKNSQSNSVIAGIIDKYKIIPPKIPFKILSAKITNGKKPLFTKFIRYIGLELNLEVKENSTVTFHIKYITPRGGIKRNSKTSPIGYTQVVTKSLNKQTSKVDFPGWGNAEECTYDTGLHRIEVYIDEYLIHTEKFIVDLAPSEKIKKKLASAERKLKQINRTEYFESEIRNAQNEMNEIKKFKWFRVSSKKQSQVQSQQVKIDKLLQKSKEEKKINIRIQEETIYKLKTELSAAKY
ncbi:hypothetical protein [Salegentibacter salarius]|uniref:Uncharacterized protein n=1 Tax=Salegentibacter salarius TaxID=435906 RepID=A0A2N0TX32_9FLAO|nr:hypothetical protein [Salegentibacter salarius]OEY72829.1 hypothetical protein BHS39_11340 [Salegentibacter salarius]PKD19289.1 hypothetical protein APR40_11320 [Salegentibacter salarius]SLK00031.1 hypothetical protein SAMN05660445_02315 [Salegentibacter salarius]